MADVVVQLVSDNPSVEVPAEVTIPDGSTSVDFQATTVVVDKKQTATVTATGPGGDSVSATLTLNPPIVPALGTLAFSPSSVAGGEASTGTVSLA